MLDSIQQLATMNALLTNWSEIQMRMSPLSAALAAQLEKLAHRLLAASSMDDLARIVDDLLDLTQDTPANSYVRELIARSQLSAPGTGSARPTLREFPAAAIAPPAPSLPPPAPPSAVPPVSQPRTPSAADNSWSYAEQAGKSLGRVLQSSTQDGGLARIPVFFATNRSPDPKKPGSFLGEIADGISFGVAPVTIPVAQHEIGKLETPKWWTLFPDRNKERRFISLGDVETLPSVQFLTRLESTLQQTEAKDILVFLHGYNVTFEEAARRAAQIAFDMRFPGAVVLFSWPSLGALCRYTADEDRATASGDSLSALLKGLEGGPWRRVHVMAHSMGNRVMLLGFADNARPHLPLGQLIFVAADVYVPIFVEKFPKLQLAGKLPATSYASKRDNALLLSDFLHKGDRVGFIRQAPYVTRDLETIDATAVDHGFLGHGYFADQRSLLTDIGILLREGLTAKQRGLVDEKTYWAFPR